MKYLKHLASIFLKKEIIEHNKKFNNLKKWSEKLEDAIVDQDKAILIQAMYSVAKRRDQKLTFKYGKSKEIFNDPFKVYTIPIEVLLTPVE